MTLLKKWLRRMASSDFSLFRSSYVLAYIQMKARRSQRQPQEVRQQFRALLAFKSASVRSALTTALLYAT